MKCHNITGNDRSGRKPIANSIKLNVLFLKCYSELSIITTLHNIIVFRTKNVNLIEFARWLNVAEYIQYLLMRFLCAKSPKEDSSTISMDYTFVAKSALQTTNYFKWIWSIFPHLGKTLSFMNAFSKLYCHTLCTNFNRIFLFKVYWIQSNCFFIIYVCF